VDSLLKVLTNLGYDLFGILLPGLVLVSLVLGSAMLHGLALSGFDSYEIIESYIIFVEKHIYFSLFAIFFASYMAGNFLKLVSKINLLSPISFYLNKKKLRTDFLPIWIRFLFFLNDSSVIGNHRPAYNNLSAKMRKKLAESLRLESNDIGDGWSSFYFLGKSFVENRMGKSSLPTFQNKYTFHRSLASAFAIMFWVALVEAFVYKNDALLTSPSFAVAAAVSLLMVIHFSKSYEMYWKVFGDTLICEISVMQADGESD
jgi:hypothetical protein